jgi:hypothetical protein
VIRVLADPAITQSALSRSVATPETGGEAVILIRMLFGRVKTKPGSPVAGLGGFVDHRPEALVGKGQGVDGSGAGAC